MDMTKFGLQYINVKNFKETPEIQGELVIADVMNTSVGKPSLVFQNVNYAWTLNDTNRKKLIELLGTDSLQWAGAKITLVVHQTEYKGKMVDGLTLASVVPAQ